MAAKRQEQSSEDLYSPSAKEPSVVRVPKMNFITVAGEGDPSKSQEFQDAIVTLYGLAYTMKFMFEKGQLIRAARVGPLEGLFWTGQRAERYEMDGQATKLFWKLMLAQPCGVTEKTVEAARKVLWETKAPPGLERLRFESYDEGKAVQVMHVGPYAEEAPTIERLLGYADAQGLDVRGPHHEIYLSDPRRTKPEKLKTIIRYPVAAKKRRRPPA